MDNNNETAVCNATSYGLFKSLWASTGTPGPKCTKCNSNAQIAYTVHLSLAICVVLYVILMPYFKKFINQFKRNDDGVDEMVSPIVLNIPSISSIPSTISSLSQSYSRTSSLWSGDSSVDLCVHCSGYLMRRSCFSCRGPGGLVCTNSHYWACDRCSQELRDTHGPYGDRQ